MSFPRFPWSGRPAEGGHDRVEQLDAQPGELVLWITLPDRGEGDYHPAVRSVRDGKGVVDVSRAEGDLARRVRWLHSLGSGRSRPADRHDRSIAAASDQPSQHLPGIGILD